MNGVETMPRPKKTVSNNTGKSPPALTPEARENQLISLAYNLAEQRLRDGSATSQEVTHFLRLGSTKEREEREMMREKIRLLTAKTEALQSTKRIEELYSQAIDAMRVYNGTGRKSDNDDSDL